MPVRANTVVPSASPTAVGAQRGGHAAAGLSSQLRHSRAPTRTAPCSATPNSGGSPTRAQRPGQPERTGRVPVPGPVGGMPSRTPRQMRIAATELRHVIAQRNAPGDTWDEEQVLHTSDPTEMLMEIEQLRAENAKLKRALELAEVPPEVLLNAARTVMEEEESKKTSRSYKEPPTPTSSPSISASRTVAFPAREEPRDASPPLPSTRVPPKPSHVPPKPSHALPRPSRTPPRPTSAPPKPTLAPPKPSQAQPTPKPAMHSPLPEAPARNGITVAPQSGTRPASLSRKQPTLGSQPAATPAPLPEVPPERREKVDLRMRLRDDFPLTTTSPMDIVFVSAEVAPWSKTGGLGDVAGSLPIALAARGHRVMVIAPRYMHGTKSDALYECALDTGVRTTVDLYGAGQHEVGFFHAHKDSVDWVFVDNPVFHRAGTPYCDPSGKAYEDNLFRYALLSLAACEAPLVLNVGGFRNGSPPGFPYGDKCVFVANDWHAGLVPCFIASRYRRHGVYNAARCVFAIHNLSHQGVEPSEEFGKIGLPEDFYDPLSWEFPSWSHCPGPAVNILKGGLIASDRIVAVSQGYAWEVTTPEGGWGLHELLRSKGHVLNGITNGIDEDEWDPRTDKHIAANFGPLDLSGKAACKAALQQELGFRVDPSVPLLGFIGRLDHQKGPDVVLEAMEQLSHKNVQVVMLGSGVEEYENRMRELEAQHPNCFRGWVGFSVPVAHKILAGADVLLMPSRFEPCGLNQLFAMRYGTLPIAHATGGLRDTIDDFNAFAADPTQCGTGWTFGPPEVEPMLRTLDAALNVYRGQSGQWLDVQLNGMCRDLSWARSAAQYEELFRWATIDPPAMWR